MRPKRGVVGIVRIDFKVVGSRSLKEKRSVVKSFLGRARSRFPVSISETGYKEDRQIASLTAAVVSIRPPGAEEMLRTLVTFLEENHPVEILDVEGEISEGDE